jgi:hypothetical protein
MDYRQRQYSLSTPLYHLGPPALLCLQAVRTMALLCLQAVGTAALLCLGSRYYGLTLPSGSRHRGLTLPSGSRHYGPGPHHTTLWPYAVVHNPHTHSLTHTCLLTHLLRTVLSIPMPPVKHTHVGPSDQHHSAVSVHILTRPAPQYYVGTSTDVTVLCRLGLWPPHDSLQLSDCPAF